MKVSSLLGMTEVQMQQTVQLSPFRSTKAVLSAAVLLEACIASDQQAASSSISTAQMDAPQLPPLPQPASQTA
eukprot:2057728-Amphidinium_carterae.2